MRGPGPGDAVTGACGAVQVSPTEVRGSLGSINQLVICIGILAALVANVFIPASNWRTMFAAAAVPGLLLAAGVPPPPPAFCCSASRPPPQPLVVQPRHIVTSPVTQRPSTPYVNSLSLKVMVFAGLRLRLACESNRGIWPVVLLLLERSRKWQGFFVANSQLPCGVPRVYFPAPP